MPNFCLINDISQLIDVNRLGDDEYLKSMKLKKYTKGSNEPEKHFIVRYTDKTDRVARLFRSCVFYDGKLVSYSPQKSVSYEELYGDVYYVEEFVEGTMVNVYYLNDIWCLSTRSVLNAGGSFYEKETTFKTMFIDCMSKLGLEYEYLNPKYSYSFLIQHPKNRIVKRIYSPTLYLCAVYEIMDGKIVNELDIYTEAQRIQSLLPHNKNILRTPVYYGCGSRDFAEQYKNSDCYPNKLTYDMMGIVIKDRSGNRYKWRNPMYEYVRKLRGNQPKLQYQYLVLRNTGKVSDYLKYYPEHRPLFSRFREIIHSFTGHLYENYVKCFIKHEKPLEQFPYEYRSHMIAIHEFYIKKYRKDKKSITFKDVVEYINKLEPPRLMYSLNYNLHQPR